MDWIAELDSWTELLDLICPYHMTSTQSNLIGWRSCDMDKLNPDELNLVTLTCLVLLQAALHAWYWSKWVLHSG